MTEQAAAEIAKRIREALTSHLPPDSFSREPTVTVLPTNKLSIVVVSDEFEGKGFDERDQWLAQALSDLPKEAREQVNDWRLYSINEAKKVYPDWLKAGRTRRARG